MKTIMQWVMAAILISGVSVFTACSSDDDLKKENYVGTSALVLIAKTGSIDYFQQIESAFRAACQEKGMQALYYSTSGDNAYEEQVEAIKQLAEVKDKRIKGIIYVPCHGLNGESADAVVAAFAKKHDIPVVLLDSKANANSLARCPFFGTDNAAAGKAMVNEVKANKVAVFAVKNSPGIERAEAFKTLKPGADIYPCGENANSDIQAVLSLYDDFVFMNGTPLPAALDMLKQAGKNIYTFDIYDEFLDELIAGNLKFKGIMAQNTFLMTQKAVDAALAGTSQGEIVPTFFIDAFTINDDIVQPYLKFYNKPTAPVIDKLAEKIVGKWMTTDFDGQPELTNNKAVFTFLSATQAIVSTSRADYSAEYEKWAPRLETKVAIDGNKVTLTGRPNEHLTVVYGMNLSSIAAAEMKGIFKVAGFRDGKAVSDDTPHAMCWERITADYQQAILGIWEGHVTSDQGSEFDDGEDHRWEYKADGTYVYYRQDKNGEWVDDVNQMAEYFCDGTLLCTRWKNVGKGAAENREWWEIESIKDGVMKWTALRQREDGTTYTATFQMSKVK